jgi:hypothetical protein
MVGMFIVKNRHPERERVFKYKFIVIFCKVYFIVKNKTPEKES